MPSVPRPRAESPGCRMPELFAFLTLLSEHRCTQGEPPSLPLTCGLRGPTDRRADRPAIVARAGWNIKCILRRAWGLRLLGLRAQTYGEETLETGACLPGVGSGETVQATESGHFLGGFPQPAQCRNEAPFLPASNASLTGSGLANPPVSAGRLAGGISSPSLDVGSGCREAVTPSAGSPGRAGCPR